MAIIAKSEKIRPNRIFVSYYYIFSELSPPVDILLKKEYNQAVRSVPCRKEGARLVKFKKNFLIFSGAWAVFALIVYDILLISAFRAVELNVEKRGSTLLIILVPFASAALLCFIITFFTIGVIRRQRKRFNSVEGNGQYAFFRNWVCILAAAAILNSVFLYFRFEDVLSIIRKDEERRISQMYYDKPDIRITQNAQLNDRIAGYLTTALVMTVILAILKAVGYLFTARPMVRCYNKHAASAYGRSKEVKRK